MLKKNMAKTTHSGWKCFLSLLWMGVVMGWPIVGAPLKYAPDWSGTPASLKTPMGWPQYGVRINLLNPVKVSPQPPATIYAVSGAILGAAQQSSAFFTQTTPPDSPIYAILNSATDAELVAAGASWNSTISAAIYNSTSDSWTWNGSYAIGSQPPPSASTTGGLNIAAIERVNNIIDLMATVRSTEADLVNKITNSFRFTPAFTPCTNAKQRSTWEHALHALEASGPLNLVKGQTRVWLCGYKSGGRVQTLPSNPGYHSSNVGALMGSEYRSLKDKWTVGLLLGTVVGKQTQATQRETFTNSKGFNYGVYGSYSPVNGLRFDAVLTNLTMVLNHQRYDPASNQTAYAKYKMNTLIGDVMASYTWKLPKDYSIRFNVGNTYVGNHADGFTETGASVNFMQKSSTLRTHEVYGGIGLRKGWMVDKLLWRLTGSYEIGRQYYHKGRAIQVSYLGGTPITITNGPLRLNHYLNANLSVLQEAIGLKGVLAYTATLSPKAKTQGKSIRQMVSVKCELRF